MNVSQKKGVSPIIATLLLIAITVAAGIIVYVFVTGLAGNLTKSGGNQVTEQVSLDSYNFQSTNYLTMYLRNTGTSAVEVSAVYFNGVQAIFQGTCGASSGTITGPTTIGTISLTSSQTTTIVATTTAESAQSTCQLNVYIIPSADAGTSYQVRIVTSDGGIFPFNVVAGSTG
ncbi:MAG: type IV pilin [Nitrososphaerota archaeon]|nr:type IV pilin [Nitrososphaerota archaeon]